MSRIEDALKNAQIFRRIIENNECIQKPPSAPSQVEGINVLIISSDLSLPCLVKNLQPLSQAEIIVSEDIVCGMEKFLENSPVMINGFELRFTALMLDTLCCCYGREPSEADKSGNLELSPIQTDAATL
jgi:hypothetical protein